MSAPEPLILRWAESPREPILWLEVLDSGEVEMKAAMYRVLAMPRLDRDEVRKLVMWLQEAERWCKPRTARA